MSSSVETENVCTICLDSDPPPIQSGCACRSDSGLAHLDCLIEKAVSQQAHRGFEVWGQCQTCGQRFTGAMLTGLGEAWWSRVCDQAAESEDRLCAAHNLAGCRLRDGQYGEAERIQREVLGVVQRVLGEEHPHTLMSAAHLATTLAFQAKFAEAEAMLQATLEAQRRVLGNTHPHTLHTAHWLECVRLDMRAAQPITTGGKAAARRTIWPSAAFAMGSMRRRSGSSGRCLAFKGGYWERSIPGR